MQNKFFKSISAFSALAAFLLIVPANADAQKNRGKSMTWKGSPGHSYSRGNSQNKGHSHGHSSKNRGSHSSRGYSSHGNSNRGHSSHRHSSHHSHRGHNHSGQRSPSYFNVSPYGFSYGRASGYGSLQLNVPFRSSYGSSNYYRPYGAYGYQYGNLRSSAYYPRNFSSYRPYSIPAYGFPGYADTRSIYDRVPRYTQPNTLPQNSLQNQYAQEQLETRSTLKPEIGNGQQQFNSYQLNAIQTTDLAEPTQRRAEQAFRIGQYSEAARLANEALLIDKDNGLLMLFSAQANFAAGYYDQAINEVEGALSRLPSEQWNYVVANFKQFYGQDDYVQQVEKLSSHIATNPTDSRATALRGYHYGALGYPEAADNDFAKALSLDPNSNVAQQLRSVFGQATIQIQPEVNQPIPSPPMQSIPQQGGTSVLENESYQSAPIIDGPMIEGQLIPDGDLSSFDSNDGIEIFGPGGQ